ncbi:hypothetical protein GE191_13165 [Serratia fonticola]|uniref:hypothetical protein n=1 Tax=Serratia fonticola TaxID=47917 RepID=UPI0013766A1C|nr:hypothetical protein [Serratia fonticola]NBJ34632.1 hypothetical protein [Serratia fonticola]
MSGFNGTPGPWEVNQEDDELSIRQAGTTEYGNGWSSYTQVATELTNNHDARLIAAAPELLEACQRARSHLYQAGYEPKENSLNPNEDLLFQLNVAISKALGE